MGALKVCVYFSIQSNFLLALHSYNGFQIINGSDSLLEDLKKKKKKGIHQKKYKISYLHFVGKEETRVWKGSEGQRDLDSYLIQSIQPAMMPCTGTCFLSPHSHN